jgi:hypothetical protein
LARPDGRKILFGTAWIDVERDALPMKLLFYGRDGSAAKTLEVQDATRLTGVDGVFLWIPTKLKMTAKFGSKRDVEQDIEVESAQTHLNPQLTDDMFVVQFPPATLVNDLVANRVFRVPGTPPETRHAGTTAGWFIVTNVVVLVLFGFWLFWRRRQVHGA